MEQTAVLQGGTVKKEHRSAGAYPLMLAGCGQKLCVCEIRGNDETKHHLAGMGFVDGCPISVVCQASGNLIAEVKGSRVALSKQMAGRVMVCNI